MLWYPRTPPNLPCLLKNNGWKCLWRGHPAQPTDQLKPTSPVSLLGVTASPSGVPLTGAQKGGGPGKGLERPPPPPPTQPNSPPSLPLISNFPPSLPLTPDSGCLMWATPPACLGPLGGCAYHHCHCNPPSLRKPGLVQATAWAWGRCSQDFVGAAVFFLGSCTRDWAFVTHV